MCWPMKTVRQSTADSRGNRTIPLQSQEREAQPKSAGCSRRKRIKPCGIAASNGKEHQLKPRFQGLFFSKDLRSSPDYITSRLATDWPGKFCTLSVRADAPLSGTPPECSAELPGSMLLTPSPTFCAA